MDDRVKNLLKKHDKVKSCVMCGDYSVPNKNLVKQGKEYKSFKCLQCGDVTYSPNPITNN